MIKPKTPPSPDSPLAQLCRAIEIDAEAEDPSPVLIYSEALREISELRAAVRTLLCWDGKNPQHHRAIIRRSAVVRAVNAGDKNLDVERAALVAAGADTAALQQLRDLKTAARQSASILLQALGAERIE